MDGTVPSGSDTDPLDLDPEVVLDELDVLLAVLGQILELLDTRNVSLPSGQSLVLHLDLGESVKVGYNEVGSAGATLYSGV